MPKKKKWLLREQTEESLQRAKELQQSTGLENVLCRILVARGYDTPEKAGEFLSKSNELLHNPYLLKDMDKAVKRTLTALKNREKITIYGDYDVDGVSAVSVLYLYLTELNADVNYYIPNRYTEGYGMNVTALDEIIGGGTKLIITVDTGVTAVEEAEHIKSRGAELIVTDHHGCHPELPDAVAVINPKREDDTYPFKELAGVGVVFKFITALEFAVQEERIFGGDGGLDLNARFARMTERTDCDFLEKVCSYLDLVTLGTISDVMTLTGENRLISWYGLSLIENRPRPGLLALMNMADGMKSRKYPKKRKISASYISFTVSPRINAAGRISDAQAGVKLLITNDEKEARETAKLLCDLNLQRQTEENRITAEATETAERSHVFGKDAVMVLSGENWNHGVIGIVASRLTERYNVPCILISVENGIGKGSGRSIKGINISEALGACADLLERYGGHELAAGLTIKAENIDDFRRRICEYVETQTAGKEFECGLTVDAEVTPEEVTDVLASQMAVLEPCGVGNPEPVLLMKNVAVVSVEPIGDGKHTRLTVGSAADPETALVFGLSPKETDISEGDTLDIVFKLQLNEFRGMQTKQLLICDCRIHNDIGFFEKEMKFLSDFENGIADTAEPSAILPDRDDFAAVYRAVNDLMPEGETVSLYRLHRKSNALSDRRIGAAKVKTALQILADVGLVKYEELPVAGYAGTEMYRIKPVRAEGRVNLFGAPRYKRIKNKLSAKRGDSNDLRDTAG